MSNIHFFHSKVFVFVFVFVSVCVISPSCTSRPSKVDMMRQEKALRDSVKYQNAQQNMRYSDSLLQVLLPQVDPLMKHFVYQKNDKAEDHGHYVHRLLQTTSNTSRNFLQAYVADNRATSVQSYYFGARRHNQYKLRMSVGEDYVEKEGSNHAFQAEGWHEIMTIEGENAIQMLHFISAYADQRICVKSMGSQTVEYVLSKQEKQALSETYQLAVLMRDIDALERAIHVSDLQIQKYEKKHVNCK